MPDRETRQARLRAGLCAACGQCPPAAGHRACRGCLDRQAAAEAARRARLRRAGVCLDCGVEPAAAPRLRCAGCLARQAARMRPGG